MGTGPHDRAPRSGLPRGVAARNDGGEFCNLQHTHRHSRAGGNPVGWSGDGEEVLRAGLPALDSRFHGNDDGGGMRIVPVPSPSPPFLPGLDPGIHSVCGITWTLGSSPREKGGQIARSLHLPPCTIGGIASSLHYEKNNFGSGHMPKSFSFLDGFNAEVIINGIKKQRKVDQNGSITLEGRLSGDWLLVLPSALHRPQEADSEVFKAAIRKTVFSPNLKEEFSVSDFQAECGKQFHALNGRQNSKFVGFFEISLMPKRPNTWLISGNSRVYFDPSAETKFMQTAIEARAMLVRTNRNLPQNMGPRSGLMPIIVHTEANDAREARTKALDSLDEMRGLINFLVNERRISQRTFGPQKPINLVRIANIQTIHKVDGSLATETFWYERDWQETKKVSVTDSGKPLLPRFHSARHRLKNNPLAPYAITALRQYARALDNSDWKNSFLELWVVLEYLTAIHNADYKKLVKRASGMYTEADEIQQIAQHLRVRRNEIVHSSSQDEDSEQLIFQTKELIEPLMLFYIGNPFRLRTRDEVGEFLDLPNSTVEIRRRKSLLEHAMHFRRPT
ncbi:hypothetical protein [Kordiimonas sp.]|uniref:hypothetical protein n=1 Tax=Kordiimonas sp. TaxID=1970157 RepID=UPI003A8D72D7